MHKLLKKVKKDEMKAASSIKKSLNETNHLLKEDKKFDKKIDNAKNVLKHKK